MNKWDQFENYVSELIKREQIPGVAVAISQNGKTIYERGFGVRNLETKAPVTPETIFGTASITKSFVAFSIMKQAEEGKLQLDDAVNKYLPNFQLKNYDNINKIKIHHLLSHTTGIPSVERKEQLENFTEHLDYLRELDLKKLGEPGEYISYNNDTFLLLGAIIEKVTSKGYQEFIENEIINPQNMNRTTVELSELSQFDNVSTPYTIENKKPIQCPWPTLGNYAVGGGIRSTVSDLVRYGNIYVGEDYKFTAKMTQSVHRTHGKSSYGYALHTTPDYSGVTLIEHGGSQPGVSSNFGFIPEKELVVAVLTNSSGVSADALWLAAVNAALGFPLEQQRYIVPRSEIKLNPKKYVGIFSSGDGSKIIISMNSEGEIEATLDDGEPYSLRASSDEILVLTPLEKPIRYFFNENKEPWALFFGLRMYVKD